MVLESKATDLTEQLTKLSKMHADGGLTDEEFKALKEKLISGISNPKNSGDSSKPLRSDQQSKNKKLKAIVFALVLGAVAAFAYIFLSRLFSNVFHDDLLIKMKPTIVNIILCAALLVGLKFGKPLLSIGFNRVLKMTEAGWRTLTLRWGLFFLVLAALNEIVWRTQTTDFWITYRTFSGIPLIILFSLSQVPLILKHELKASPTT